MEKESRVLFNILDKIGVNMDVASWCRRNGLAIDAFDELKFQIFDVCLEPHTIGSFSDGSFREGFLSDIDNLHIYNHCHV